MSTLDEINEDWQINGLPPTWAKLQQATQEQAALSAERDALAADAARLIDEVAEARQEISEQARVCGMGAEREARLMARINGLEKALRELHDATQLVSVGSYNQEAHDIAVSRARAALEKKHEGT